MNMKFNVASVLGYSVNVDEDLAALTTANPTQTAFLHIFCDSVPVGGTANMYMLVHIKFYATLFDLKSIGESVFKKVDDI